MRPYEMMVLLNARLEENAIEELLSRFEKVITDGGGTVKAIDRWGRRRLAYEIDRMTEGYYAVYQFDAEAPAVAELNRVLRITDGVIRHVIVRPNEITRRGRIAAASRRQPVSPAVATPSAAAATAAQTVVSTPTPAAPAAAAAAPAATAVTAARPAVSTPETSSTPTQPASSPAAVPPEGEAASSTAAPKPAGPEPAAQPVEEADSESAAEPAGQQ